MELLPGSQQHHWGCGSDSQAEMPHNSDLLFCSGFCHLPGASPGSRPCSVHTLCWDHNPVTPPPLATFLPLKLFLERTHSFFFSCLKKTIWCLLVFKAMEFSDRRILQQVKKKNFMRSESSWVLSWDPFRSRFHKTDQQNPFQRSLKEQIKN